MNAVLFTNSSWGIPTLLQLAKSNMLKGIVIPANIHEENELVEAFARENQVPVIRIAREEMTSKLKSWLQRISPDVALCNTFPYLLPKEVLDLPEKGIVNFHYGKLPEYGGADPLFWILRERQATASITVHLMGESFDQGYQIHQEQVSIFPGENWGLLGARLSVITASLIEKVMALLEQPKSNFKEISERPLKKRPELQDLTINWSSQSAEDIEALVNASNPKYGGAITYFRNAMVRILEVSPADVSNAALLGPGSIVHADQQNGLFVLCSDYRFLRINMVRTPEAYLTGHKLAALGIRQNEKFYSMDHERKQSSIIL